MPRSSGSCTGCGRSACRVDSRKRPRSGAKGRLGARRSAGAFEHTGGLRNRAAHERANSHFAKEERRSMTTAWRTNQCLRHERSRS
jgi:hypothetical protein